jgi:hypothetical protein
MALGTAPAPISVRRAVSRGRRGIPTRVALPVTDALAPCIEGQAFADDVDAGVVRIVEFAARGSRMGVVNEANRLGFRATTYRAEFRRMASEIEQGDDFDDVA